MESVVNRWIVDYYLSLALKAFDQEQSENFHKIKNVLDSVLVRPVEYNDTMPLKLRVIRLLSCINDSERLDASGDSAAPLERALKLLQGMRQDCSLPQQELENMCTSVKEMLVVILIKANKFDKAKEVLTMHFPYPMVGKKAIFMGLISQRSKTHEVIQQSDFVQLKKETSAFCQKLCPLVVPFLHKAAKQLIDSRVAEPECNAARPDEQEEPCSSSVEQIDTIPCLSGKHKIMQRSRLEAAYKMLYPQAEKRTFAQLEEEVEREEQERTDDLILRLSPSIKEGCSQESEPGEVFQRGSGSPMEASVADHPSQTDAIPDTQSGSVTKSASPPPGTGELYTVARLVVEPDSLSSSQCTVASQEVDVEVLEVESPQSATAANKKAVQRPLSDSNIIKPSMNLPKRQCRRALPRSAVVSTDSEEDLSASEAEQECFVLETQNKSNSSLSNSPKSQGVQSLDEYIEDSPRDEDPRSAAFRTPEGAKTSRGQHNGVDYHTDSSLDSSPGVAHPRGPLPQTSSTPDSGQDKNRLKWKQLYSNAKESKETWSDEETNFPPSKNSLHDSSFSVSGHRKKKWTERETRMLIEGVRKYGEGNWTKIKTNYGFSGRTNINLKDRWRTLKKLNQN